MIARTLEVYRNEGEVRPCQEKVQLPKVSFGNFSIFVEKHTNQVYVKIKAILNFQAIAC